VSQWEHEQISKYPEISFFTDKLKSLISANPGGGFYDPLLSSDGKIIPCRKRSINVSLFSHQYSLGYEFITAYYIYNSKEAFIFKMKWGL
jgi:hypothetical protein